MVKEEKEKIIAIINDEKWIPIIHPTNFEMEASEILNRALENIKMRLIDEVWNSEN